MKKKVVIIALLILVAMASAVFVCDLLVSKNAEGRTFDDTGSVPHRRVGLILGTSPVSTWNGRRPDIKEPMVRDFTRESPDVITLSHLKTKYGDLICLKPDMSRLRMDMVCGEIPSAENDSIILAFAGAFTGTDFYKGHSNIAGDHVSAGKRFKGYRCKRNTGAFTWSAQAGPKFFYKDYSSALDKAAREGGMGFAQEMMIHDGTKVPTTRPAGNKNVFRALCLDADGDLALYESQGEIIFGNFIDALLSQGVREALYTDMGQGWNYCFYRSKAAEASPEYLHSTSLPYASNFITLTIR